MPVGTFSLVLHSHLPYYRKAGMWPFGEENLYEAICETYLPLLNVLYELREEGIAPKLTIGITPVLAEQLADDYLKNGFEDYVAAIIGRIEKDVERYTPEGELAAAKWTAGEKRHAKLEVAKAEWAARRTAGREAALATAPDTVVATPNPEALPDSPELTETRAQASTAAAPAMPEALPDSPELTVVDPAAVTAAVDAAMLRVLEAGLAADPEPTLADIPEEALVLPEQPDPRRELSVWYLAWFTSTLQAFRDRYGRDVLGAFRQLQDEGAIEIITSAATHGFSPLLARDSSLNAQFKVGVASYRRHFGRDPKGVWLPECAYRPSLESEAAGGVGEFRPPVDQFLRENGLEYFFTDAHAVVGGKTAGYRRHIGLYGNIEYVEMPERPLSGLDTFHGYWLPENPVAVYARNERAGWQVWSADMGYPGDPWYREFHKKDSNSGMKYWRVNGPGFDLADKDFYNPQMAAQRIAENSDHYVTLIHDMLKGYQDANGEEGHVVVTFDTELFGHWWFEGPQWIKAVVRKMATGSGIRRQTVGELHASKPPAHAFALPESSWGAGGHYHVWMNPQVEWMWPIIHRCEKRMELLVAQFPEPSSPLVGRALAQAGRELLVLEGSDWPFLVTTGQAKVYATDRFNEHVERFDALVDALVSGTTTEELVAEYEAIDNLFPDLDYHVFANRQERVEAAK